MDGVRFRLAGASDAPAVAALHAASWRRHYRGAYSDAFLDGDVTADRFAVWSARLADPGPGHRTVLAEDGHADGDGGLLGFAHVALDDDPDWGALLDNLHVTLTRQRGGVGTQLLALAGRAVLDDARDRRLYLWVLEQNTEAQGFYRALGGSVAGSREVSPPGGEPGRLVGSPVALRMTWPDPAVLARRRDVELETTR